MIEVLNLTAGYENEPVLRSISLTAPRGQVTVLLGPNGCGKSTLLKSLLGMTRRLEGQILVDGKPLEAYDTPSLARRVSYLPQNRRVPDITVERLVLHGRFPYLRYPRRYRQEDRDAARAAMAQVGITEFAGSTLNKLSGGTRQKAYIAMALAQDTQTILLDEPNAYLDIAHQLLLMELCRKLSRQDRAVVLVLHDLNLAMEYGDQILLMDHGKIAARGTPEEVFTSGALDRVFGVHVHRSGTPGQWQYSCRLDRKEL